MRTTFHRLASLSNPSASIGHAQDDEDGGMTYMRARWYEPASGRFLSEDPAMDGWNWFAYCGGDPVNNVDPDGRSRVEIGGFWVQMQNKDGHEIAWGRKVGGNFIQMGQVKPDGSLKHVKKEEYFNKAVQEAMRDARDTMGNVRRPNKLQSLMKTAGRYGGYGLGLAGQTITSSLDGAFLSDPAEFCGLIDDVGGDWALLGGYVNVSAD